jgi:hypothetical protein
MLIVKMSQDNISVAQARLNVNLLCDLHTLLALSCLLPLMEVINALINFAQGRDLFICSFVATIKICQVDLFMMYLIHSQIINMNISKFFVTLWTTILLSSPKIGLLTSIMVRKTYLFIWLVSPIKLTFCMQLLG